MRRRPLPLLCLAVLAGCGASSDGDAQSDSPIKLIGVDPIGGLRSATNMNVLQTRAHYAPVFDQSAHTFEVG